MSAVITVQLEAVEELAAELAALAGRLSDDARLCTSTAASFATSLSGDDGWRARATATAWASLTEVLAEAAGALAITLRGAAAAYRAADAGLAGAMDPGPGHRGGPR